MPLKRQVLWGLGRVWGFRVSGLGLRELLFWVSLKDPNYKSGETKKKELQWKL